MNSSLRRTPLFDLHVQAGGRMVPFAGWEMPVQYESVIAETRAVREACGVFDVSHMVQYRVAGGTEGTAALNRAVSADWTGVPVGGAAYALLLTVEGGILDDVMGYRRQDDWIVVGNASRYEEDRAFLAGHLGPHFLGDALYDGQEGNAMLAIQGPDAARILGELGCAAAASMPWRTGAAASIAGVGGYLVRGGYTGSDGFEFMFPASGSEAVWRGLLGAGAVPAGLGARDVLRLEAGLPLYGHELREEWTPAESGVGFAYKPAKGEFVGREGAGRPPLRKIVALRMEGRAIPREGYAVQRDGQTIGEITSGTMSPTLGAGIALASVLVEFAPEIDQQVDVAIRNATHTATAVKKPFVPFAR